MTDKSKEQLIAELNDLHKEKETFHNLINNSRDILYRMSLPDGKYEFISQTSSVVFGYSPEEFYEKPLFIRNIIHPEWHDYFEKQWKLLIAGDMPPYYEYKIIHKSGETRWMNQRNVLIRDKEGNPAAIEGIITDITERNQILEKLRKNDEQNRLINDSSRDVIYSYDRESRFTSANKRLCENLNLPCDKIIGKTHSELGFPEDLVNEWSELHRRVLENGETVRSETTAPVADGVIHNYEVILNPLHNDSGDIIGISGTTRDITERIIAANALKESDRKYRLLIDNMTDMVSIHEPDGTYKYLSPSVKNILGYDEEELLGKNPYDYFHPDDINHIKKDSHEKVLKNKEIDYIEYRLKTKSGKYKWLESSTKPILDSEGNIISLQLITKDIHERKQLENQLQIRERMDSLGTLASGIAYDFNNLLTGIIGNLDLLKMDNNNLNIKQKEYLEESYDLCQQSSLLIRDFQSLSDGSMTEKTVVDLYDVSSEVFKLLSRTTDKLIEKKLDIKPGIFNFTGQYSQMHQVLLNLGTNAVQAITEKGVRDGDYIRIQAGDCEADEISKRKLPDNSYIHIIFEDSGSGMSEEVKRRAFEPLFSTKNRGSDKGQGLGLAMVYTIITQNHEGYIYIESKEGEGTQFHIYLPKTEPVKKTIITGSSKSSGGSETILVIEDEEVIRTMVEEVLTRYGYSVLAAADGLTGLNMFRENSAAIDLVILDLTLPQMSGKMVLDSIISDYPDAKIILSSGQSIQEIESHKSAKGYIVKPYKLMEFISKVRTVLDR